MSLKQEYRVDSSHSSLTNLFAGVGEFRHGLDNADLLGKEPLLAVKSQY